jgi:L-erythro-3,5-diaminohexanoate dehydrogenase
MKAMDAADLEERLGADRVIEPAGVLPQPAARLDPSGPVRACETEIAVDRLCLDSTSFRQIRESSGGEPGAMAARILEIVTARGKMHNPETDSGGVLCGTVTAAGELHSEPPPAGERVVSLCSLTLVPLRLDRVVHVDPSSPQVQVEGVAYVPESAGLATVPGDMPLAIAIDVLDVCAAASQVRLLAPGAGSVAVLGVGHAGKLAMAAARDAAPDATLVAVDIDAAELERMMALGLCDLAVTTDLRDSLRARSDLRAAGARPAELTVDVVNAPGCESAAILATADGGTVLFFSMATSFATAALAADGIGAEVRMAIGSGYAPDHGDYALELVRADPALREAIGLEWERA